MVQDVISSEQGMSTGNHAAKSDPIRFGHSRNTNPKPKLDQGNATSA